MRAAVVDRFGPPSNVRVADVPMPSLGPGEVLVRVEAAAAGFPDLLIISGGYQLRQELPFIPGSDFAGRVTAAGRGVTDLRPGDRVCGSVHTGAFAEYVSAPASSLHLLPDGVDAASGAAFTVAYSTAWHSLHSVAHLRAGERLGVLGSAGGVGLAVLDLGVLAGADVVAVVTGTAKAELCRERGASMTIDLARDDLRTRMKERGGVDVVVDMVGGSATEHALRALRPGGRLVTIGYASGEIPCVPLNLVLLKGISIAGLEMRTFPERFPDDFARGSSELGRLLASGTVVPHVCSRFPLERTSDALGAVAGRVTRGRVVIDICEKAAASGPSGRRAP